MGAEDEGDDAPGASAARAGEDVGAKRPLEELGPGEGAPGPTGEGGLGCHRARGAWAGGAGAAGAGVLTHARHGYVWGTEPDPVCLGAPDPVRKLLKLVP